MYLGAIMINLGVGIGIGSFWVLFALLPAVIMTDFLAIRPEEEYLERKFGDEYRLYKASVRRWL